MIDLDDAGVGIVDYRRSSLGGVGVGAREARLFLAGCRCHLPLLFPIPTSTMRQLQQPASASAPLFFCCDGRWERFFARFILFLRCKNPESRTRSSSIKVIKVIKVKGKVKGQGQGQGRQGQGPVKRERKEKPTATEDEASLLAPQLAGGQTITMASANDSNSGPARAQVKQEVKEEAYGRDTEDEASLPAPPASGDETEAEGAGRQAGAGAAGGSAPPPDAVSVRILVPRCSPSDAGPSNDGGGGCDRGSATTQRREGDSALANENGSPVARATGGGRGDAPSSTGAGTMHGRSQDDAMLADAVRRAKGVFEDEGGSSEDKVAFYEALRRASETYWEKANPRRGRRGCGVESGAAPVDGPGPGGGAAKKRKGADAPSSSTKRRSTVARFEHPTRQPVVKQEFEQQSSTEPPPSEAGPAGLMRQRHEREANGARANGAANAPAAACCGPTKSTKQKEVPRQKIAVDMRRLGPKLLEGGVWNLRPSSFRFSEALPLDDAHFDEGRRRYRPRAGSDATEDDVILQAIVVFALYRMERGWGKGRSFRALSVWGGRPAPGDGGDDDGDFPLENLWKEEIRERIDGKRLGRNTLGHADNYDNFPRSTWGSAAPRNGAAGTDDPAPSSGSSKSSRSRPSSSSRSTCIAMFRRSTRSWRRSSFAVPCPPIASR